MTRFKRLLVCGLALAATAFGSTAFGDAVLTQDEDWRGKERTMLTGMIDLNGHKLTVSTLIGDATITDSSGEAGELIVNVESGTVDNTTVALTGSLKLVKEGEGTLVATKTGQTYAGGTEVKGGRLELYNTNTSGSHYGTYTADMQLVGASNSTLKIDSGATMNVSGIRGLGFYNFELNGGTLANEDFNGSSYWLDTSSDCPNPGLGLVTLTADSALNAARMFVFEKGRLDLGGHTLTINFNAGNKYVFLLGTEQQIVNGTILAQGGASTQYDQICTDSGDVDMRTASFDMVKAQFKLVKSLSVSNYTARAPLGSGTADNLGSAALNVYGTFKPCNTFFYGCTMQDGSTIDLSEQTGAWSTTSTGKCPTRTVSFASGAKIFVVPPKNCEMGKVIDWTNDVPANWQTLKFKSAPGWEGYRLRKVADGVYFEPGGLIIVVN